MWFLGAVLGAVLAANIHSDLWIIGALLGGLLGWSLGSRARRMSDDRFKAIDQRLSRVEAALQRLEQSAGPPARLQEAKAAPAPTPTQTQTPAESLPAGAAVSGHAAATPVEPPAAAVPVPAAPQPRPAPPPSLGHERPLPTPGQRPPLLEWLLRGNLMARAGIVILFFGVAFLLKYSYAHMHVPIELRLTAVGFGAGLLLLIGWRLRVSREGYALALQGGGVGLLYLTIFGALRLFGLLPAGPAFALLLAVAALSAALALLQDALVLAVLGAAGGFLAPILAASGEGSHVALFSYYAVLNAGILAIAWFKAWRLLNLLGFAFTFGIATVWGVLRYRPEAYASSEPFLVLFFLIYVAIPVLFSRREAGGIEGHLDNTLIFGVPLVAFGLQVGLVREFAYGAAWSALALGAFYLLLARTLWSRRGQGQRLLVEAFLALGTVFATLAIPLAFDGRWTSASWAIEGAAVLWVGVRQGRVLARLFGVLLQVLAGVFLLHDPGEPVGDAWPLLNSAYLGALLLALAGLFCAWLLQRHRDHLHRREQWLANLLLAWGLAWWAAAGLREIERHLRLAWQVNTALLFFTGSCLALCWLERRLAWPAARHPALALLPLMALLAVAAALQQEHPLAHLGYLAWPTAFAAHWLLLRRHEAAGSRYLEWLHAAGLWLLAALGAWEVGWAIDRWVAGQAVWPLIAWALVPGALLALLALRGERIRWPVAAHLDAYLVLGATPLAFFLGAWFVWGNAVSDGNPWPLFYVPVLNPLDLAQAAAVLAVATWCVEVRRLGLPPVAALPPSVAWGVAGAAAFLWVNAVLLRTLHHWAGVPFHPTAMLRSDLVQASLSLLWTLLALAAMVLATRRAWRPLWLLGAALMAVVVAKLFLVELSNAGTVERIVSFLGVGVLMLVIGYLAPAPAQAGWESAMKLAVFSLLWLLARVALAEAPGDFAFGMPLEAQGPEALFQVEVPAAVYEGAVRADLGDLRVFNARGEPVPHAFLPRPSAPRANRAPLQLPFFALRGDAGAGVAALEVRIERQQGRAVVTMNGRDGVPARAAALLGYLVDASAVDQPLQGLALELRPDSGDIVSRVQVDASDDLARWATLVSQAPVLRLQAAGQRFEQLRVEFPPRKAKYFRLSWPAAPLLELAGLKAEPGEVLLEARRMWTRVTGNAVKDAAGEYTFDLGGQFPVDRLRLLLPQSNTVASVEFLARAGASEQWRRVAVGSVYRLGATAQEVVNPDLVIAATTDRHWRLRVDQRGGGLGAGAPALVAGWLPQRLVFAARGAAPFQLAYGSSTARPSAYPIATLLPGYGTEATVVPMGTATSGTARTLAGESATRVAIDWKRWAMWGSLLFGVALLAWMAWRLGRQLAAAKSETPETPETPEGAGRGQGEA